MKFFNATTRTTTWLILAALGHSGMLETTTANDSQRQSLVRDMIVVESLLRLGDPAHAIVHQDPSARATVQRYLQLREPDREYLDTIARLKLTDQTAGLLRFLNAEMDANLQTEAIRLLIRDGHIDSLRAQLGQDHQSAIVIANGLGFIDTTESRKLLQSLVVSETAASSVKIAATTSLGRSSEGQVFLLDLMIADRLPSACEFAATNALKEARDPVIRQRVEALVDSKPESTLDPLPSIQDLVRRRGDGKAGKLVFQGKGTCSKCHKVHGEGKDIGPDLSEIGSKLSREAMYVAILNPNAGISHNYEQYTLLTYDGLVLSGLLVNENENEVTLKTAEGVIRTIERDEIEEFQPSPVSLMPENLHQAMSIQELLDLVDYLVLLKRKDESGFHVYGDKPTEDKVADSVQREANHALDGIEIAQGLTATLFASEPMLHSPSSLDVDAEGRVWICEVVNYRHFRNPYNPIRDEGDRILVFEDSDGDHVADRETVFYQGTDINSAHGVCVLGDRVIVSAGDQVLSFRDIDGDLKADEKIVLFSEIGGADHDHGIHAIVPGPDGKLYFNFGNEGKKIHDAQGRPIVDKSGRIVADHGKPYQQGMVFRCDPDGSNLETLAWNFRNNWEVCVDSFGMMWQSDNDDDGNRATRINYVMPYGNYGYRGELDGATWSVPRTGQHENVSLRHWHLNDPGVVPNVVQTGAGSPTGIMKYEGIQLPERFHNQLIHCDPGPNSVRAFVLSDDGAGFSGTQIPLMTGTSDKWFRPVDVAAAPDGSLYVADWYDPGVGGHRMGDTDRGRIFWLGAAKESTQSTDLNADYDDTKIKDLIAGLQSPNVSARFVAAQKLRGMAASAHPPLLALIENSERPAHRARAIWVLSHSAPKQAIDLALQDVDEEVRCVAYRIASEHLDDATIVLLAEQATKDASVKVHREAVLSLRGRNGIEQAWSELALLYDGQDRWFLEALGIAADGRWDLCFDAWIKRVGDDWNSPAGRAIIWRSRATATSEWLARILVSEVSLDESKRYLRAFDFQPDMSTKTSALRHIIETLTQL